MIWQIIISAFSLGLLSSFHCVGMCGAIAFSLPTQNLSQPKKAAGILLYNAGRIFTYTILGVIFGLVGRQIYLGGFQQWFSIIAGIIILLLVIKSVTRPGVLHIPGFNKMNAWVQKIISKFLNRPTVSSSFFLGMANGLLPCGLVYLAITGALASGTILGAAGFMASFGLGTFPAMFLLSYFGFRVSISNRNRIRKAVPFVVAFMGVMLIVRGLGLDIPYVSPVLKHSATAIWCN